MSYIEKILVFTVLVLIILVHTIDAQEQEHYIAHQCNLTPEWSACNEINTK